MQVGLFHSIQWPAGTAQPDRYEQALEQALFAEDAGFESVWLTEHHFSRHGIVSDSLAVLAYLAGRTSHVRLGTAVSVLPLHHPLRLAEAAATVDVLSHGRLDLGVGKGYQVGEFQGFGLSLDDREQRFDEALAILLQGWTSSTAFDRDGPYWSFKNADPQPKPVQRPHPPIWLATDSDSGFAKCAKGDYGLLLPQGRSLSAVADQVARYRSALAAQGREFDPARVVLARTLYVGPNSDRAWSEVSGPYGEFLALASSLAGAGGSPSQPRGAPQPHTSNPLHTDGPIQDSVLFGDPVRIRETLADIEALGIQHVIMFVHIGGLAHDQIMRSLRLFATEVLPDLAASALPQPTPSPG